MTTANIIKNLKKGNFVIIDDIPCRVVSVAVSKSGKHGGSKCRVEGIGLLDGRRRSIVKPADVKINIPIILKKEAQILALVGQKVQLMDLSDYSTFELDIPEELKGKINPGEEINYFEIADIRTLKPLK